MTAPQILAFAVLGGTMILFLWGRLRYDLVAALALLVSIAVGIVKPADAFRGFSDDIVIIVGAALVVSAAVARSGLVELALARLSGRFKSARAQLLLLVGSVTIMSALVKNIGALAMMMPAAIQMAKRSQRSPSLYLMPMAFGSLLGGLMTLVGTSPNIIVARERAALTGTPFHMFDYLPVGLGLAICGVLFLVFAYPLIPKERRGASSIGGAVDISDYVTEVRIGEQSRATGMTIAGFMDEAGGDVTISALLRGSGRRVAPLPDAELSQWDTLLLAGAPAALERAIVAFDLDLVGRHRTEDTAPDEFGAIEAVVTADSPLAGQAAGRLALFTRYGVNLLAVSRAGRRFTERLRDIDLHAGDVLVLQGPLRSLPEQLAELGCVPLAERPPRPGSVRRGLVPIAILAVAMLLTALQIVPVAVAFFGAAVVVLLSGTLPMRHAYEHVEWPILIMLGALIPVSDALRTTGDTDLIAAWLSHVAAGLPPWGAVTLILVAAMAVTPFLNNAATVLVMAPIAANFAHDLGLRPDAFLMATAVGAGCDFLTPVGHQCNMLVMGPGGYRFTDYARLGAPLSLIVIVVGVALIMAVWPVR